MDLPGLVTSQLGTEEPLTQVPLGGEDLLLVTPSRTLVYHAEGLLRDESIDSYPHDCDRVALSTGRRKATLRLEYIDGTRDFSVPRDRLEDVLAPVLRGVLSVTGVTEDDERVEGVYRFSELTLIITEGRVVKHVGTDLWSPDCEVFPFDDVTGLTFEEGSVATAIVLEVAGRPDRVKAPNDDARYVRRDLERVLFDYHDVSSLDELNEKLGEERTDERPRMEFEDDLESLVPERTDAAGTGTGSEADTDVGAGDAGFEFGLDENDATTGRATDQTSETDPESSAESGAGSRPKSSAESSAESGKGSNAGVDRDADTRRDPDRPGDGRGDDAGPAAASAGDSDGRPDDGGQDGRRAGRSARSDSAVDRVESASNGEPASSPDDVPDTETVAVSGDETEAVVERLDELSAAVKKQNELLATQQRVIKALIKELRQGR